MLSRRPSTPWKTKGFRMIPDTPIWSTCEPSTETWVLPLQAVPATSTLGPQPALQADLVMAHQEWWVLRAKGQDSSTHLRCTSSEPRLWRTVASHGTNQFPTTSRQCCTVAGRTKIPQDLLALPAHQEPHPARPLAHPLGPQQVLLLAKRPDLQCRQDHQFPLGLQCLRALQDCHMACSTQDMQVRRGGPS